MDLNEIDSYLTKITTALDSAGTNNMVTHSCQYDGTTIYCGQQFDVKFLKNKTVILTHHGKFHMDELLAICMLLHGPLRNDKEIVIIRNREGIYTEHADYVLDVGKVYNPNQNRFDHHQVNFDISYPDRTSYATAGLVFMKYGEVVIRKLIEEHTNVCLLSNTQLLDYVYTDIYTYLKYVDNLDNGQKTNVSLEKLGSSANWVTSMNPTRMFSTSLESDYTHNFIIALTSLRLWFKNFVVKSVAMWLGIQYLDELDKISEISNNPYLVIPYDLPWKELIWKRWNILSKFSFIIVANREMTNWSIHHVPTSPNNLRYFKVKIPFELLGLYGEDLETITGIADLIVCNNTGYITYAKTKQAAIAFVNYVWNRQFEDRSNVSNQCKIIEQLFTYILRYCE